MDIRKKNLQVTSVLAGVAIFVSLVSISDDGLRKNESVWISAECFLYVS